MLSNIGFEADNPSCFGSSQRSKDRKKPCRPILRSLVARMWPTEAVKAEASGTGSAPSAGDGVGGNSWRVVGRRGEKSRCCPVVITTEAVCFRFWNAHFFWGGKLSFPVAGVVGPPSRLPTLPKACWNRHGSDQSGAGGASRPGSGSNHAAWPGEGLLLLLLRLFQATEN